jgi:hypothetical protein
MSDLVLKQSISQAEQDAITLDFTKWSAQRIKAKLPNDHNLWQIERDRTLEHQQSENAEIRRKYLAKIDRDRNAKKAEAEADAEIELQSEKKRLQNEWLANNPTQTAADFEKKAWHLLKENLIEQRNADTLDAEIQRQKQSGRYSF